MSAAVVDSVVSLDRAACLYGEKITQAWSKSIEGIVEAGTLLIQAKNDLPHGDFERMVKQTCPFKLRTAQTLMQIARHSVLSNTQRVACLPAAWGTLGELARFEPNELKHAIGNHWVKPEMTRADAKFLRIRVQTALGTRRQRARRRPGQRKPNEACETATIAEAENAPSKKGNSTVRVRRLDPDRVFRGFVETLESLIPSCDMIDPEKITPSVFSENLAVLRDALRELNRLQHRLERHE